MFNLGMGEITVILLLALIFLGPKKLPELASGLGKLIREIRKTTSDVKNEIQLDEAIRKPLEELREAVTLHPEELKRRDRLRHELEEIQRKAQESAASMPAAENQQDLLEAQQNAAAAAPGAGDTPGHSRPFAAPTDPAEGMATPLPTHVFTPAVPETAPAGTIAREGSGPTAPPAPPLAAVLAKGSGPVPIPERRAAVAPPTGSDFLRSLRAVPSNRKATRPPAAAPPGAADRSNITQNLTDADLAAVTVSTTPPPPPPPPLSAPAAHPAPTGRSGAQPPSPVRLPGATPPKTSND